MKLTQLSKKPELIKVELTDEDTIKEYGEPLDIKINYVEWEKYLKPDNKIII